MAGTCCCNTKSLFCTAFYPKYFAVGVNRVNTTIDAISLKRRMDFAMSINFVRILKHLGDFILPLGLFVLRYRRLCILTIFSIHAVFIVQGRYEKLPVCRTFA